MDLGPVTDLGSGTDAMTQRKKKGLGKKDDLRGETSLLYRKGSGLGLFLP
jgi:hypothetical protein